MWFGTIKEITDRYPSPFNWRRWYAIPRANETVLEFQHFAGAPIPTYQYKSSTGVTHHFRKPIEDGVWTLASGASLSGKSYRFLGNDDPPPQCR